MSNFWGIDFENLYDQINYQWRIFYCCLPVTQRTKQSGFLKEKLILMSLMVFKFSVISAATIEMEEICCGSCYVHFSCSGRHCSNCFFSAHAGIRVSLILNKQWMKRSMLHPCCDLLKVPFKCLLLYAILWDLSIRMYVDIMLIGLYTLTVIDCSWKLDHGWEYRLGWWPRYNMKPFMGHVIIQKVGLDMSSFRRDKNLNVHR